MTQMLNVRATRCLARGTLTLDRRMRRRRSGEAHECVGAREHGLHPLLLRGLHKGLHSQEVGVVLLNLCGRARC